MTTGDREDTLGEYVADRVRDLARQARVAEPGRQGGDQAEPTVGRSQQEGAAIGTGVRLIERRDHRLVTQIWKQNSVSYRTITQRNRLRLGKSRLVNSLVPTRRRLCFRETRSLVNYSG